MARIVICVTTSVVCLLLLVLAWERYGTHCALTSQRDKLDLLASESGVVLDWSESYSRLPLSGLGMKDLRWLCSCELSRIEFTNNSDDRPIPDSFFTGLSPFSHITEIIWLCSDGSAKLASVIERQKNLKNLTLYDVTITDRDLAHAELFAELETLDLDLINSTDIDGTFLKSASGARKLHTLRINNGNLSRRAFQELSKITSLRTLVLNDCELTASGALSFASLSNLEHLSVRSSLVDDSFAAVIRKLPRLKYLDVSYTHMSLRGLDELKKCGYLESVIIGIASPAPEILSLLENFPAAFVSQLVVGSELVDLDFSVFRRVGRIKELFLKENCVNDEDLAEVAKCESIEIMTIDSNRVTLMGVEAILRMPKLRELRLCSARWPPEIVDGLIRSRSLQILHLPKRSWPRESFPALECQLKETWKGK